MNRAYYSATIEAFLTTSPHSILGQLADATEFPVLATQITAWLYQIELLKQVLKDRTGGIYFEYSIPRMGRRVDVLLVMGPLILVLEFKVGDREFTTYGLDQVWDYAMDLKNFHETSHHQHVVPVLIATEAQPKSTTSLAPPHKDGLFFPVKTTPEQLSGVIEEALRMVSMPEIDLLEWEKGRYCPTPTIIEAAMALYNDHDVADIVRKDADEINMRETTEVISEVIYNSRHNSLKSICFVTGVPGAGKTLVGLNLATKHLNKNDASYSVFLSGNGPLVSILREALARDKVSRAKEHGTFVTKTAAKSEVSAFIQNVHHFRDECLKDSGPPIEHVALFDEAQRAWDRNQTNSFMRSKKGKKDFNYSEPEFLISCLDRHESWAVIVCLVGGGQEINTGEAGIGEWIASINEKFPHWHIHISPQLFDVEYGAGSVLRQIQQRQNVTYNEYLHLAVSMRSFRAENVSLLVKQLLDINHEATRATLATLAEQYPIVITRDLRSAKLWLKTQARGSERIGLVASSQAQRLKPHAIDVKTPLDPIHYFLAPKDDVRSSYYLEDAATEFHVQGLELDWVCVVWDADLRYSDGCWDHRSFSGTRWVEIKKTERQQYLKNAYRVLLTRARQGMVITVPEGDPNDHTRLPLFYDTTYNFLKNVGFTVLEEA